MTARWSTKVSTRCSWHQLCPCKLRRFLSLTCEGHVLANDPILRHILDLHQARIIHIAGVWTACNVLSTIRNPDHMGANHNWGESNAMPTSIFGHPANSLPPAWIWKEHDRCNYRTPYIENHLEHPFTTFTSHMPYALAPSVTATQGIVIRSPTPLCWHGMKRAQATQSHGLHCHHTMLLNLGSSFNHGATKIAQPSSPYQWWWLGLQHLEPRQHPTQRQPLCALGWGRADPSWQRCCCRWSLHSEGTLGGESIDIIDCKMTAP